jgi:hypothetical protein
MFNTTTIFIGFLIGPACMIYTISGMSLDTFHEIERQWKKSEGTASGAAEDGSEEQS